MVWSIQHNKYIKVVILRLLSFPPHPVSKNQEAPWPIFHIFSVVFRQPVSASPEVLVEMHLDSGPHPRTNASGTLATGPWNLHFSTFPGILHIFAPQNHWGTHFKCTLYKNTTLASRLSVKFNIPFRSQKFWITPCLAKSKPNFQGRKVLKIGLFLGASAPRMPGLAFSGQ